MGEIFRYFPAFFTLVGLGLLVCALLYRRRLRARASRYERTPATVIDNVESPSESGFLHHPVVEYFVGDVRFTLTGSVGSSWKKKIGTKLTVMFNPANPVDAHLVEGYYFAVVVLLVLGAGFVAMGSVATYAMLR
jgi:hypothetical protein